MTPQQFTALQERAAIFRHDPVTLRKARLQKLVQWLEKHEEDVVFALQRDFNKPRFETLISEVMPALTEARYAVRNLKRWMKSSCVRTPMSLMGHRSYVRHENKGVVLVISPWNYPFQLAVVPLISAIAAGNTVVIKPSELTPHTSDLIKKMAEQCFYSNEVTVELGGKEKTEELLNYNFDHVFFTGSTVVGKVIAEKCAGRLIPTTLELGGKSPTIVDETANLNETADKLFWGKYLNRAQTCVAPDYLILHESIADSLVQKISALAAKFDGQNKAYIINERHHQRLQAMLSEKVDLNSTTLVLLNAGTMDHPSMKEEIFGPVLPYLTYKNPTDLNALVLTDEKPLSLYVFSKNKKFIDFVLNRFPSGGAGINSVIVQFGNHHLPFGGVGHSGNGAYHGKHGFIAMSHARAVIQQSYLGILRKLLMPPYSGFKMKAIEVFKDYLS
jgi:aldehyde dehydrogenase (NAD+)